ncbi:MAG: hypothetical protein E7406_01430 [Ruminococcaceae bacterium]|nr:hypothetical protein [Oscillospiraceae bacterium]
MKNSTKAQNKLTKQEKEKMSNRTVLISSFAILYGILLLFFKKMCSYSGTVLGAVTFMEYLMWISLAGAMLCAAWSAYKEKKGYYIYSGMFLFVFLSILLILRIETLMDDQAYIINFGALVMAVIMSQIYYALRVHCKFTGWYKIVFLAVVCLALMVMTIAALEPKFWDFLRSIVRG